MAPTATLITGKALGPRPRRNAQGNRGVVNYLVSTADPDYALTATGLPAIGDAYGTTLPGSYCQDIAAIPLGGGSSSPANVDLNGWCRVEATYGPPETTGITPDLSSWTEVRPSVRSERVYKPLDPATGMGEVGSSDVNEGIGYQILYGWVEVSVHTFHVGTINTTMMQYILQSLTNLLKTNDSGIILPRYSAPTSQMSLTLGAEQALYLTHEVGESSPGVIRLSHHLAISKNHLVTAQIVDERRDLVGETYYPAYGSESFVGLW